MCLPSLDQPFLKHIVVQKGIWPNPYASTDNDVDLWNVSFALVGLVCIAYIYSDTIHGRCLSRSHILNAEQSISIFPPNWTHPVKNLYMATMRSIKPWKMYCNSTGKQISFGKEGLPISRVNFFSDVNECSHQSRSTCHQNATCRNLLGSYLCTCQKGFTGNGTKCLSKYCSVFYKTSSKTKWNDIDNSTLSSSGHTVCQQFSIVSLFIHCCKVQTIMSLNALV